MLRSVNVRAELHALFAQLADAGKREYLEAAAIGQHRTVESVELMESASPLDDVQSGAQVEVVRVSQDNLSLDVVLQFVKMHAFHRTQCAHRHEDRGLNLPVVCCNQTSAGIRFGVRIL